jgi:RES domain
LNDLTAAACPACTWRVTPAAALLETVFHDVHHDSGRIIYERNLRGMLMAHVCAPAVASLADLRDPELARLGLRREQVVSGDAEHYPCTRRLAVAALAQAHGRRNVHGLIWHSRQAELAGHDPVEGMVLYGGSRYSSTRDNWRLFGPGAASLFDGPGRLLRRRDRRKPLCGHRTRDIMVGRRPRASSPPTNLRLKSAVCRQDLRTYSSRERTRVSAGLEMSTY